MLHILADHSVSISMGLTRITQPLHYPDGSKARWSNDGTDETCSAVRIKFNNENGIPLHQVLDQEDLSGMLNSAADEIGEIPTKTTITLCVSVCSRILSYSFASY